MAIRQKTRLRQRDTNGSFSDKAMGFYSLSMCREAQSALRRARADRQGLFEPVMSPLKPLDWALHLATTRATVLSSTYKLLSDKEALTAMPYGEWRSIDVGILRHSYSKVVGGRLYETAIVTWSVR